VTPEEVGEVKAVVEAAVEPLVREIRLLRAAADLKAVTATHESEDGADVRTITAGRRKGESATVLSLYEGREGDAMARVRYRDGTVGHERAKFLKK
jgi:hypothetical protein